jgi:multidrug efflux pump subunit AcrB
MNPIVFAMRHPITVMVALAGVLVASGLALLRMRIDIFPNLNLPVVYVVQPYGGMDPAQMEGLLTFHYENHFLYISGIHHVESRNIQGFAQMKIIFHPGTDMVQAMAEVVAQVNRARSFMPPGTVAPFVIRFDTGSVPVGYLVLSSKTKSIDEIQEAAYIRVRPSLVSLPGVSAPPPFGGNQRTIVLHVDPDKLRAYNLSPNDVVTALASGNAISPSGNLYLEDSMPIVPVNAMVVDPQELRNIPIRPGASVYLRDLGTVEDAADIRTSFALVNGRRAVYMMVSKRAEASTLAVVNSVKAELPRMQDALPPDIELRFEFDQSPYVTRAMEGVAAEGAIGAVLTGLMVLLFLRDWRAVIVVVLNIPFALLAALVALWMSGQTLNLMTLGGLALAVGILVDEATVEVENIHAQMERTSSVALAVCRGNAETAVPRLLAVLCILAVFIPSFFMEGAARAMFVPLSLAVGFAMVASYILSSTFVPVLSVWLLHHAHAEHRERVEPGPQPAGKALGSALHRLIRWLPRRLPWGQHAATNRFTFARLQGRYAVVLQGLLKFRWVLIPTYVLGTTLIVVLIGSRCGTEIFPFVDSGQFQLRLKAPVGTRIERTEEIAREALAGIQEVTRNRVEMSVGFGGVTPSSYPINTVYLWTAGPEEVVLRVALKPGSGLPIEELRNRLREYLPNRLGNWLRRELASEGLSKAQIEAQVRDLRIGFEPADIINEVMSFGSDKPIEVAVSGPNFDDTRAYAARVREQLARIPTLRDLDYVQTLNYPTLEVRVDRERAGFSGVTTSEVAQSLVAATSSSRFVVPNYWRDPKNGVGYQVQVEIPQQRMNSVKEVSMVPVKKTAAGHLMVRDVARVEEGTMPGEYDRYNMRRVVSMTANIEGEDLGRAAERIDRALAAVGDPPRGVTVAVRGQIVPMRQMFNGLGIGLAMAVVVILLLLTAYFQSPRLAFVAITTVPAVLAGVVLALWTTATTLNIQSFMGAIMAIGVAIANAILLVTFAEQARRAGADSFTAAREGGRSRLRPILMTSFAMIAGMLPMALALQEGGEQTAPLGRAVIGGLLAATLATLLVLPAIFAVVQKRSDTRSVSVFPFDPDSRYFAGTAALAAGPSAESVSEDVTDAADSAP